MIYFEVYVYCCILQLQQYISSGIYIMMHDTARTSPFLFLARLHASLFADNKIYHMINRIAIHSYKIRRSAMTNLPRRCHASRARGSFGSETRGRTVDSKRCESYAHIHVEAEAQTRVHAHKAGTGLLPLVAAAPDSAAAHQFNCTIIQQYSSVYRIYSRIRRYHTLLLILYYCTREISHI